jgi:SAM-dependent methyltransferase
MRMMPERFFELFMEELGQHEEMHHYYKFLRNPSSFHFRRNYFLERLRYISAHVPDATGSVWDCGSGYGTTGLFLAMNGVRAHGTTLEFYYEALAKRRQYWNQFGDTSLFTCSYENLFDNPPAANRYDTIIVQDTLHHLEPIDDALRIFHRGLKSDGKVVVIEENGNNLIQRIMLYKLRGGRRIIKQWDDKLQKEVLIGNENVRSYRGWSRLFRDNKFIVDEGSLQYVRYYPPFRYRGADPGKLLERENEIQKKSKLRREFFFFGLNFVAGKY